MVLGRQRAELCKCKQSVAKLKSEIVTNNENQKRE